MCEKIQINFNHIYCREVKDIVDVPGPSVRGGGGRGSRGGGRGRGGTRGQRTR